MLSTRSDNTPKIPPRTLFWGPYNAKPIIKRALCKSHVNRATKLKLYSYMGIGKYLWVCPKFSAIILETTRARKLKLKTQLDVVKYSLWLHSVNFPMISGNCYATARKLNLKIPLDMVKYPFWVQKNVTLYDTTWGWPPYWVSTKSISPGQTTANNCKTAFSLHFVESASDDYNF